MATQVTDEKGSEDKNFFIFVDGEKYEPSARVMTPNDIIVNATGLDPAAHYLVKIKGNDKTSYRDNGNEPIELGKAEKFQVLSTGPTTVSCG